MSTITNLHFNKTGKVSDKWESYLTCYDKLFHDLKTKPINILEVGIRNGGSLETWAEYFKNAINIIGCDIDSRCNLLTYSDNRIKVIVDDVKSNNTYSKINSFCSNLDIVIDDGSHNSIDILETFVNYFPMLNPGGIFVIEDTHTLYWKEWNNERNNPFNAYIFFKKLIDVINFEFWKNESTIEDLFKEFFVREVPVFLKEGWIESIEFRNSLIIIKKSIPPLRNTLGKRIVRGDVELEGNDDLSHNQA